ncbi:MAG: diadenylate cyclase CdaA [Clostridia bacterium]|nr:diadenylate cyclase CdaA [Clostridia bacterium]
MQGFLSFFARLFSSIGVQFSQFAFADLVDIALLAAVLYYVYRFVRERRAGKLALGLGILLALYALCALFDMRAMSFLLQNVVQVGLLALIILFQPELRAALEKVGGDPFRTIKNFTESKEIAETVRAIDEICIAAGEMSRDRTGALIVLERGTKLGDIEKTGVCLDAVVSQNLLRNIFFNKASLHDGAVIISGGRIAAAGCFLPLTQNSQISKDKGTRHRAGVGMSEVSDAIVVVVSEETGEISLCKDGHLMGGQNYTTLKRFLTDEIVGKETAAKLKLRRNKGRQPETEETREGDAQ